MTIAYYFLMQYKYFIRVVIVMLKIKNNSKESNTRNYKDVR